MDGVLVWYFIPEDKIIESRYVDAHFYGLLVNCNWDNFLLLGGL